MADTAQGAPSAQEVLEAASNQSQIAVHWREEEYVPPPQDFINQANANDESILERFAPDKFPECHVEYAEMLDWDKKWDQIVTPATRRSSSGSSAAS